MIYPVLILGVPIFDTLNAIFRRVYEGKKIGIADKNHIHHFLFNVKKDIRYTVLILVMMQMVFSIIGHQVSQASDLLTLMLFILLFYIYLNLFDQRLKRR